MKKTGLGRGLDALLPEIEEETVPENAVVEIDIGDIDPNREQPRKRFDEEALRQLAASIQHSGVIQPIIVYPREGRYVIVAGERRYRASRLAGLSTIPAIVRSYDRVKQMEVALLENIQREDLNPVEEAQAIRRLMDECGLTQEAVSAQLGAQPSGGRQPAAHPFAAQSHAGQGHHGRAVRGARARARGRGGRGAPPEAV